jgi:hypothetical protein
MTRQREILVELAKHHGININQAEEIWNLLGGKIAEVISNSEKKTNGLYDIEKFPVIHIDNFGKFIPASRQIKHANYHLKNKNNEHNT